MEINLPPPPSLTYSIESKHEVTILGGLNEFIVKFFGPSGSEYVYQLRQYYESSWPSIIHVALYQTCMNL